MVTRFGNSCTAKSKLGQVSYLNTLTFHSCGFQLMVHTTPNRPYFVYHPIFITTRPISWVTAWTTHPLTVSDFCHLIMQLAYIKSNEVLHEQKYTRYLLRLPSYNLHKLFTITVFLGVTPHSLVDPDEHAASTFTIKLWPCKQKAKYVLRNASNARCLSCASLHSTVSSSNDRADGSNDEEVRTVKAAAVR